MRHTHTHIHTTRYFTLSLVACGRERKQKGTLSSATHKACGAPHFVFLVRYLVKKKKNSIASLTYPKEGEKEKRSSKSSGRNTVPAFNYLQRVHIYKYIYIYTNIYIHKIYIRSSCVSLFHRLRFSNRFFSAPPSPFAFHQIDLYFFS